MSVNHSHGGSDQQRLDLFEGEEVEVIDVKLKVDGDTMLAVDPHRRTETVAFLVIGQVTGITMKDDKDDRLVRSHAIAARRVIEMPFPDALKLIDDIDRRRMEAQGITALPFK